MLVIAVAKYLGPWAVGWDATLDATMLQSVLEHAQTNGRWLAAAAWPPTLRADLDVVGTAPDPSQPGRYVLL